MFIVEVLLRTFFPKTAFYESWAAAFLSVGHSWTSILLAILYFLPVLVVALLMKIFSKDPLDRGLEPEPSQTRERA